MCRRLGVHTGPAFIAPGVAVCPLFSWYRGDFSGTFVAHAGFDTATFWPEVGASDPHDPQEPAIADFFLSLNIPRIRRAAALRESCELNKLWTFSHFLPRHELNESGSHHVMPAGVAGDSKLDSQLREATACGHVFGHSHVGQDRVYHGVRYVQHPMGYPADGHREERPLQLWAPGMPERAAEFQRLPAAVELGAERVRGALWGALCADALSMPVCWYYGGQRQIKRDYGGPLTGYVQPPRQLLGSLMRDDVLPTQIEHGRAKFWKPIEGKNSMLGYHYHHELKAGDITLEGHILRLHMRAVALANGALPDPEQLRIEYVKFMSSSGHGDTWVNLYHREFFKHMQTGASPEQCAQQGDAIETMDALSVQLPVIIASARHSPEQAELLIAGSVGSLRRCSPTIAKYGGILAAAMRRVLAGEGLGDVADALAAELLPGQGAVDALIEGRKDPMASTSLVECFPSMLHYLCRYRHSFRELVLAQANVGGECVHRGAVLGALAGAAHGMAGIPEELLSGLVQHSDIKEDVEAFVAAVC
eukprot:TRINITY_DN77166_c0_g1_i1.p1 TRINITY_DN77166_c0_g1~~TRINITY_DN77166_c0_g1_i1.p1  ORF type:complete len:534 (+),score=86.97 TRINITY_DN77166_c0_g1_i1:132-1733(+)